MVQLKLNDFYKLRFIGNLNFVSGKLYFEIFRPVAGQDNYESGIYRLDGRSATRYTAGVEDRDMVADNRGELLAYTAEEDKKTAIYVKNVMMGEQRKLWQTEHEIKNIGWSSNSKGLFVTLKKKEGDDEFRIVENYPIYLNGEGFLPFANIELLFISLKGKVENIIKGDFGISDFAVNPLKSELALIIKPDNYGVFNSKIGILSIKSGEMTFLDLPKGNYTNPGYFDDGTLYFLTSRHERSISQSMKLAIWREGELREIAKHEDISLENSVNSDSRMGKARSIKAKGDYVYLIATVRGRAGIYRTKKDGTIGIEPVVTGDFSVDSFDFGNDCIYFIAQNLNTPQEIYKFDGKTERVTSINKKIENLGLQRAEKFNFNASDGMSIEGWFMKGKGKGTIVQIHGGPRTSYGEGFLFEFHLLNSIGLNILFSNPRGSDGYGDDFALSIKGKYGERDYQDIMDFLSYAVDRYKIHEKEVGVIGGSYGGFMVNWIIGHTNRFKAAVTDRSIGDHIVDYFSGDIGPEFDEDQVGGTPYENIEHFWEKSPLKYMKNCKTPLLIIHSYEDYRCPIWQAYELYTQLKIQGSKVKMVLFKGENHDLSRAGKPKNRIKRLEEISKWFVKNLNL